MRAVRFGGLLVLLAVTLYYALAYIMRVAVTT